LSVYATQKQSNSCQGFPGHLAHDLVHLITVLYSLSVPVGPVSLYASPPHRPICPTAKLIPASPFDNLISILPFPPNPIKYQIFLTTQCFGPSEKFLKVLSIIESYLSLLHNDWINFAEIFQNFSPSRNIL